MAIKIEFNSTALLDPLATVLAQCKAFYWNITKNTTSPFDYRNSHVATELQYGILGKILELSEQLKEKNTVQDQVHSTIEKVNLNKKIINFYAINSSEVDPRIINLSKKIDTLILRSENNNKSQKIQEKAHKYSSSLLEFPVSCSVNHNTTTAIEKNKEKIASLTTEKNSTLSLTLAHSMEKKIIARKNLPTVLTKIINILLENKGNKNQADQDLFQCYPCTYDFPLSQPEQITLGKRILFHIDRITHILSTNPSQALVPLQNGAFSEDTILHRRALQCVLSEVLLAELTNDIANNNFTAVTANFAILENMEMNPADLLPNQKKFAYTLFEMLHQFYNEARNVNSSLPHPESGVFKHDFGRIAFTGEHQALVSKEFKIQVLHNFGETLKKTWSF